TSRTGRTAARAGSPRSAITPRRGASGGSAAPGFLRYLMRKLKKRTKTAPPTMTAARMYNVKRDCHCSAEGARAGTRVGNPRSPEKGYNSRKKVTIRALSTPRAECLCGGNRCAVAGVSLEAGSSSGGPATAAPKRSALGVVIAIVIAVAATAAAMDLVIVPALTPTRSADFTVHLMTFDVGYDRPNYNPQWEVKAGQLIVVTMNNSGTMAHEFLLFSGDRGAILATVRYALALAESHNSGYQND